MYYGCTTSQLPYTSLWLPSHSSADHSTPYSGGRNLSPRQVFIGPLPPQHSDDGSYRESHSHHSRSSVSPHIQTPDCYTTWPHDLHKKYTRRNHAVPFPKARGGLATILSRPTEVFPHWIGMRCWCGASQSSPNPLNIVSIIHPSSVVPRTYTPDCIGAGC